MKSPHEDEISRARWERAYGRTRRGVFLRRLRIKRLVEPQSRGILVDLGSGDGLNSGLLRERGFEQVVALDCSVELLRKGRCSPSIAGDARRLPFRDGSIRTLFADSFMHHLTDYGSAAGELARVLEPGGRLYYLEPRASLLRRLLDWLTLKTFASRFEPFASRRQTLMEEWDCHYHWLNHHDDMEEALAAKGLERRYRKHGPMGMFLCFEKPGLESEPER